MPPMDDIQTYYADPAVRARMTEFLGGNTLEDATAEFVAGQDVRPGAAGRKVLPGDLPALLSRGEDVSRSLWDAQAVIADLDIEYVNFDFPAEAYLEPQRTFELQAPVENALKSVFSGHGLAPLHLVSGRGHHYLWQVRRGTRAFDRLMALGRVPDYLHGMYGARHPPADRVIPQDLTAAFSGLALLMEYLAQRVKEIAAPQCEVPVELTAVAVGPVQRGREMISLDISEYGDPLHTRSVRIPFSAYLKPWQQRHILGEGHVSALPLSYLVPWTGRESLDCVQLMRDPAAVTALARESDCHIPDASAATDGLIDAYEASKLGIFHRWFFSQEHQPPHLWPQTYDSQPLEVVPPCVRYLLEHPNDNLEKPAGIEQVTRTMLALGWHPRHVAGLIRSKYERDFNWGLRWHEYSAGMRADFYVRVFAGLFATGRDDLVDFNCRSTQEKHFCFAPNPGCNLEHFRLSLLERRRHGRLASRPFNRLFLPDADL